MSNPPNVLAAAMQPEVLYQFRALDPKRREGIEGVLLRQKIWFSDPASFNDPSELKPKAEMLGTDAEINEYAEYLLKKLLARTLPRQALIAKGGVQAKN